MRYVRLGAVATALIFGALVGELFPANTLYPADTQYPA